MRWKYKKGAAPCDSKRWSYSGIQVVDLKKHIFTKLGFIDACKELVHFKENLFPDKILPLNIESSKGKMLPIGKYLTTWKKGVGTQMTILGAGGAGKTTVCRMFEYQLADEIINGNFDRFPVYVKLSCWDKNESIEYFILEQLNRIYDVKVNENTFKYLNEAGFFVFIIDDLSEIDLPADLSKIYYDIMACMYAKSKMIICSRTDFFRENVVDWFGVGDIVEIQGITETQVKRYMKEYFEYDFKVNSNTIFEHFVSVSPLILRLIEMMMNSYKRGHKNDGSSQMEMLNYIESYIKERSNQV